MRKDVVKDFSQLSELIERKGSVSFDKPIKIPKKEKISKPITISHSVSKLKTVEVVNSEKLDVTNFDPSHLIIQKNGQEVSINLDKMITESQSKDEYQEEWKKKDFVHKKMVAKKNRKWLEENRSKTEFKDFEEFPDVYNKIDSLLDESTKRKWIIHLISNFLPLNKTTLVPKLPSGRTVCSITNLQLTDIKHIKVGDRDKYLAFTGENTTNVLCGIAVQELYRCAINYTYDFYSPKGQIINFCLDNLRQKERHN